MAIGQLASLLFANKSAGKKEAKQAAGMTQAALDAFKNLYVPTIEEQKILLENPELVGLLENINQQDTRLAEVQTDPRLREAMMASLDELSKQGQVGLSSADLAALNQIRRSQAGANQAANAQIMGEMAQRGSLDSGNQIAMQMASAQRQADQASQQGDRLAEMSMQARRDALSKRGNMAAQLQAQDFNQVTQKASAQDIIDQFNIQGKRSNQQYNIGTKQDLEKIRAGNVNIQEQYNKGLPQTQFANQSQKASGLAGQYANMANMYNQQAASKAASEANKWQAIGNAAGMIGGAALGGAGAFGGAGGMQGVLGGAQAGTGDLSGAAKTFGWNKDKV
jgi:hypothetical protein